MRLSIYNSFILLCLLILLPIQVQSKNETQLLNLIEHKTVNKGDSLYQILVKNDVPLKKVNKIISQKKFIEKINLSPKAIYSVLNTPTKIDFRFYIEIDKIVSVVFNKKFSTVTVKVKDDDLSVQSSIFRGRIDGSISKSISKHTNDPLMPFKFRDVFVLHYDLNRLLQPKAKYWFQVEQRFSGTQLIKYGRVLHASLELKGKPVTRKLVDLDNGYSYVGIEKENKRPFFSPVDYLHVSSLYKKRRFHPVRKRYLAHHGIDFSLPKGKPVYSVKAGRIYKIGKNRIAGKYIGIRHKNGMSSYYNHLDQLSSGLKKNSWVKTGETIGTIGCTGSCTKPHLHFAIKKQGRFINPISYVKSYPFRHKKNIKMFLSQNL